MKFSKAILNLIAQQQEQMVAEPEQQIVGPKEGDEIYAKETGKFLGYILYIKQNKMGIQDDVTGAIMDIEQENILNNIVASPDRGWLISIGEPEEGEVDLVDIEPTNKIDMYKVMDAVLSGAKEGLTRLEIIREIRLRGLTFEQANEYVNKVLGESYEEGVVNEKPPSDNDTKQLSKEDLLKKIYDASQRWPKDFPFINSIPDEYLWDRSFVDNLLIALNQYNNADFQTHHKLGKNFPDLLLFSLASKPEKLGMAPSEFFHDRGILDALTEISKTSNESVKKLILVFINIGKVTLDEIKPALDNLDSIHFDLSDVKGILQIPEGPIKSEISSKFLEYMQSSSSSIGRSYAWLDRYNMTPDNFIDNLIKSIHGDIDPEVAINTKHRIIANTNSYLLDYDSVYSFASSDTGIAALKKYSDENERVVKDELFFMRPQKNEEEANKSFINSWLSSSRSLGAQATQFVASEKWGRDNTSMYFNEQTPKYFNETHIEKLMDDTAKLQIDSFLDKVYNNTQEWMSKRVEIQFNDPNATIKDGKIKLYRGVEKEINAPAIFESWTTKRSTAKDFDGHDILEKWIPLDAIYVMWKSPDWQAEGAGMNESEYIVISNKVK